MKPGGKLLRFNRVISGVGARASVTVINEESRAMKCR